MRQQGKLLRSRPAGRARRTDGAASAAATNRVFSRTTSFQYVTGMGAVAAGDLPVSRPSRLVLPVVAAERCDRHLDAGLIQHPPVAAGDSHQYVALGERERRQTARRGELAAVDQHHEPRRPERQRLVLDETGRSDGVATDEESAGGDVEGRRIVEGRQYDTRRTSASSPAMNTRFCALKARWWATGSESVSTERPAASRTAAPASIRHRESAYRAPRPVRRSAGRSPPWRRRAGPARRRSRRRAARRSPGAAPRHPRSLRTRPASQNWSTSWRSVAPETATMVSISS